MTGHELQQLYIIRAQIDLLIGTQEGVPEASQECPHPEEQRRDKTNFGEDRHFLCLACGQDVKGQA